MEKDAVTQEPVRLNDYTPVPRKRLKGGFSIVGSIVSIAMFAGFFIVFFLPHFSWVFDFQLKKGADISGIAIRIAMLIVFVLMAVRMVSPVFQGIYGLWRRKRMRAAKDQYPQKTWLWDYPWQIQGTGHLFKDFYAGFIGVLIAIYFLIIVNTIAFAPDNAPVLFQIIVLVIDVLIGGAILRGFYRNGALLLKTGGGYRLRFKRFPFYLGDHMSLELVGVPSEALNLKLDLRCVEVSYEAQEDEVDGSRSQGGYYQVYHDSRNVFSQSTSKKSSLTMGWDLPNNLDWATSMNKPPIRFWELEIQSQTPEVKYEHKFLLPVYG